MGLVVEGRRSRRRRRRSEGWDIRLGIRKDIGNELTMKFQPAS